MAADARGRIFTAYKMTNKNATQKLHHTAGAYIDSLTAMTHQLIGAYIHDRGHTLLSRSICNGHILPQDILFSNEHLFEWSSDGFSAMANW